MLRSPASAFYLFVQLNLTAFASWSEPAKELRHCKCERSPASGECGVGYCVYPGSTSDVLYYFHGAGGSLKTWQDPFYFTSQVQQWWQSSQRTYPTVIAISYGSNWLLASPNSSPKSGLFEHFESQLRPRVERELFDNHRGSRIGKRMVVGESMGAFNALQLSLRTESYQRAAILCAVLAEDLSPFTHPSKIVARVRQSTAFRYHGEKGLPKMLERIQSALGLAQTFYPSASEWKPFDPLHLAAQFNPRQQGTKTRFYIASGFHDEFASFEGNARLAETLKNRGYQVDWRPQWGGHCAVDIPSLGKFLSQ